MLCLDLELLDLCGNVNIWLVKFDNGGYDVIVLVVVGLEWLGLGEWIVFWLVVLVWLLVLV